MKKSRSTPSIPITGQAIEFPELEDEVSLSSLRAPTGLLSRLWRWIQARHVARSSTKRLRVAETVSLGEKRFVAVVQVDGRHFLLAGGPTNIALLAQLDTKEDFEDVLKKTMTIPLEQPAKRKLTAIRAEPAKIAHLTQSNGTQTFAPVRKKTRTAAGRQRAKRTRKQNAAAAEPATKPLMPQSNTTETFGDVLQKTMNATRDSVRQPRKQNSRVTTEQMGHYA